MNKNKIATLLLTGAFVSIIGTATDKIAERPNGTNPTPKRLVVVVVAVLAVNFGEAAIERFVNRKVLS